jgi:hypothetical protein
MLMRMTLDIRGELAAAHSAAGLDSARAAVKAVALVPAQACRGGTAQSFAFLKPRSFSLFLYRFRHEEFFSHFLETQLLQYGLAPPQGHKLGS